MNWAYKEKLKRKIHRCEFCGTDVSTPYKGVHDEAEMILGIPVPCRNNGRMNIHIWMGIPKDQTQPKEGFKWFVEHPETHEWWTGYKWTKDPNEAFGCEIERTAERYAMFQGIKEFIITEHEFVSPPKE